MLYFALALGCLFNGPSIDSGDTDMVDSDDAISFGSPCVDAPDDCEQGLVCAGDGYCRNLGEAGTAAWGQDCAGSDWCQLGLVCDASGICAEPGEPGTAGVGDSCDAPSDCQQYLDCSADGTCFGFQPPLWTGATCAEPDEDTGPFRVFFEVPEFGVAGEEFYRLPTPNDIRMKDGQLSLAGHPTPGVLIPALGDVAAEVIAAAEDDLTGWGANQTVLLRFSDTIDTSTLSLGLPGTGSVAVVNITPTADEYGEKQSGGYSYTSARGQYICHNWMGLDVGVGWPYLPNNTYAAIVTTDVTSKSGQPAGQDADFAALVSDAAPSDARLAHAWAAYAPLRGYLTDFGISSDTIAVAAVFTVGDPRKPLPLLREAAQDWGLPVESGMHLCDGDPGPYEDATDIDRGCPTTVADLWHEVQGTLTLPRFQAGTPPYKDAKDGGGIDFSNGPPPVVSEEAVQFTLTIPDKASMPEGGWPIVLYGHGTNGNYRNFVDNGIAEMFSHVTTDDARPARFAILAIDAVNHGPRRHSENWDDDWLVQDPGAYDPDVLFFNPLNPRAARDNALQAAADYFSLTAWAQQVNWTGADSPTGVALRFNPDHVYYVGHSQGGQTGVGFVAYEPEVRAAIFSGAGGVLTQAFKHKTKPVDLPSAMAVGLADPEIDEYQPLLNIAGAYADPSDAVNHGAYVARWPQGDNAAKHVLQFYGIGDSYTPESSQKALARTLRLQQLTNGNPAISSVTQATAPVSDNRYDRTLVVSIHNPTGGSDGHFVLFDDDLAKRRASQFLATAFLDDFPVVVDE
jgi:hypothetical protein